jgi:hypothetical protein
LISTVETRPSANPNFVKFKITLTDGSRLHVSEDWRAEGLAAYSYYWIASTDALIIGWDNSPHHPHLANFPHHKHIGQQRNREPSYETTLEDVLVIVKERLSPVLEETAQAELTKDEREPPQPLNSSAQDQPNRSAPSPGKPFPSQ